jgi:hypothetical protein
MAARKRKPAIERRVGHSYGDLAGYGFELNYDDSVEVSKQLNRRGVPTNDLAVSRDFLISVAENAAGKYAKNNKQPVKKKNVKRGAK